MNNEPNLEIREEIIKFYKYRDFEQLFEIIADLQNQYPRSLFLLNVLGNTNSELGKYKEAINNFENILKISPNFADAYYNLGLILKNINQIDNSIDNFEKCIKINPKKFEAYNNLGNIYKDRQQVNLAVINYIKSLEINPNYLIALQNLGVCLQNFCFSEYSDVAEKHIVNLLDKNKILRPVDIINNLINFIYLNSEYNSTINNYSKLTNIISLDEIITKILNIKILVKLFKITPITDLKIEKVLKNLRAKILLNIKSITNHNNAFKLMELIASQCYVNEYIYPIKGKEKFAILNLEKKYQDDFKIDKFETFILEIACLAAYKPLGSYDWSNKIIEIKDIKDLVKQQIINPKIEKNIRKNIISKEIKNIVSLKVKNQYENSPYPRWEKIALKNKPGKVGNFFKNLNLRLDEKIINNWDSVDVLVAGCGTGQHAITTATKYQKANVTALDLSAHSLSYAKRKADELEIKNINFIQMDLLNLKSFNKKFNIIEAVGVLHHMNKPYEGWKVLYENLVIGGLMMIGLYSDIARKHVVKIRNDIKKLKIKIDKENIINFREKIILSNNSDYKIVTQSTDFYSYSNLVDLLFHVQEQRFTIPEINSNLKKLNLNFCGFEDKQLLNSFNKMYKNPNDLYNLDLWNKFEIDNPRIFAGMYQFWCQKI